MKKKITRGIIFILVLIMVICSFSACKKHEEARVGEAVITFIEDFHLNCNFDKALEVCEKEAYDSAVKEAEDLKMCFTEEELKSMADVSNFETFNIKTEELTLNGNTADVKLLIKMPNEEITRWNYKLEKNNGKWKIVSFNGDYNEPNKEKVAEIVLTFTNNYYTHYRFGKVTPSEESKINNPRYTWDDKIKVTLKPLCKDDVSDTLIKEVGDLKGYFTEEEIENFAEKARSEAINIQTDKIVVRWDKAVVRLSTQIPGEEIVNLEYKLEKTGGDWIITSINRINVQ